MRDMDGIIEHLASAVNALIRFFHPPSTAPAASETELDASLRTSEDDASVQLRRQLRSVQSVDECQSLAALVLGKSRVQHSPHDDGEEHVIALALPERADSVTAAAEEETDASHELVPALLEVFRLGFHAKAALGPNKHIWDFISRATRKLTAGWAVSRARPCVTRGRAGFRPGHDHDCGGGGGQPHALAARRQVRVLCRHWCDAQDPARLVPPGLRAPRRCIAHGGSCARRASAQSITAS